MRYWLFMLGGLVEIVVGCAAVLGFAALATRSDHLLIACAAVVVVGLLALQFLPQRPD